MRNGARLALVLSSRSDLMLRLRDFGILDEVPADQVFEDIDRAIEWAENRLVRDILAGSLGTRRSLDQVGVLHNFDPPSSPY